MELNLKNRFKRTKKEWLSTFRNIALVVIGTFVLAFGTSIFIIPFKIVTGGVSGIGIILHQILKGIELFSDLTPEFYASVVNWILFFIGFICLGKSFAAKTLVSTLVYPIALAICVKMQSPEIFDGFFNLLSERYAVYGSATLIVATVFGGACVGAGCALTFLGGGSTGGVDVIAFTLCKYVKKLKSSVVIFLCDATIVILGMFIIEDLLISLLGIISAFICALSVDKMFIGESKAFIGQIISDKYEEMSDYIINNLNRTTTLFDVVGGYSQESKKMILVSFTVSQYNEFISMVTRIDKNAFVTIHRAHEINGEGWTYSANTKK